ncbi:DUF4309 domain-containing protein [Sporosalibacterium faouarense]|uniref:DUF4309 domain-containing protein n=1 Tax=Sporosalibacterium faouarense TaxID=516123 RepID=UPI00192CCC83|nr:DUF4309 domain-containing protein [Sporosalibacterium faouarense]
MRKISITLYILICIIILTACQRHVTKYKTNGSVENKGLDTQFDNELEIENQNNSEEEKNKTRNYGDEEQEIENGSKNTYEVEKPLNHEDNPLFKQVKEGKLEGIEFGIGTYSRDIVEKWGMPDRYDNFMGGLYLAYDDKGVVFSTYTSLNDGKIEYADVMWIGIYGDDKEICNVKLGMNFKEIISVLGEPSYQRNSTQNEAMELYDGECTIEYETDKYILVFVANKVDEPVSVAYLFENR